MIRHGKALGTLDWKTDKIYLMDSAKPTSDKKFIKKVMDGKFIKE